MKYEFDLHTDRAELLKSEFGDQMEVSVKDDKFSHVVFKIDSNWDMLKFFHSALEVGRLSMTTKVISE